MSGVLKAGSSSILFWIFSLACMLILFKGWFGIKNIKLILSSNRIFKIQNCTLKYINNKNFQSPPLLFYRTKFHVFCRVLVSECIYFLRKKKIFLWNFKALDWNPNSENNSLFCQKHISPNIKPENNWNQPSDKSEVFR